MRVFFFGEAERQLLGTLHVPQRSRFRTAGVLLCNPFGEEATRIHRTYRVLAGHMERAGYPVLRFDYSCTGDSGSDAEAATVDVWTHDVACAAAELRRATGVSRVVPVGVGLGGALAAMWHLRSNTRSRHIVLWDPVVDGAGYLNDLAASHRRYMRAELPGWRDALIVSGEGYPAEAMGAPISTRLAAQLSEINLCSERLPAENVTLLLTRPPTPTMQRFVATLPPEPATRVLTMPGHNSWDADDALAESTVPTAIVHAILERLEEVNP